MKRVLGQVRSFGYALSGVLTVLKLEANFNLELALGLAALALNWALELSWLVLVLTLAMSAVVLGAEVMNTAVEKTVDIACDGERLPAAKTAKDLAAGAVLVIAILAAVIEVMLVWPGRGAHWQHLWSASFARWPLALVVILLWLLLVWRALGLRQREGK